MYNLFKLCDKLFCLITKKNQEKKKVFIRENWKDYRKKARQFITFLFIHTHISIKKT